MIQVIFVKNFFFAAIVFIHAIYFYFVHHVNCGSSNFEFLELTSVWANSLTTGNPVLYAFFAENAIAAFAADRKNYDSAADFAVDYF